MEVMIGVVFVLVELQWCGWILGVVELFIGGVLCVEFVFVFGVLVVLFGVVVVYVMFVKEFLLGVDVDFFVVYGLVYFFVVIQMVDGVWCVVSVVGCLVDVGMFIIGIVGFDLLDGQLVGMVYIGIVILMVLWMVVFYFVGDCVLICWQMVDVVIGQLFDMFQEQCWGFVGYF